ncbi:cytochrome BD oxidase subunit I, partial [Francisella tularensis]|nr:cytochrome BD oxidase subunit I [Francisella tularensis]
GQIEKITSRIKEQKYNIYCPTPAVLGLIATQATDTVNTGIESILYGKNTANCTRNSNHASDRDMKTCQSADVSPEDDAADPCKYEIVTSALVMTNKVGIAYAARLKWSERGHSGDTHVSSYTNY